MHRGSSSFGLAIACVVLAGSGIASAEPKRALPDYDGRGNEDREAGSWALWIPRVALAPLYVVNEFVLRRPIGMLIRQSERGHWMDAVTDVFTFGSRDNYLLLPTVLFDFGLRPSAGLYFAGDAVLDPRNSIRIHAATGGVDWLSVTVLDRFGWHHGTRSLAARLELTRRPDLLFLGIGPSVTAATKSRYGIQRADAGLIFKQVLSRESALLVSAGVRGISFRPGCCSGPTLTELVGSGMIDLPAGFDTPYAALYQRVELVVDTRATAPKPGSGGYLHVHGDSSFDVKNDRSWIGYGAVIGAAADVTGHQRSVKLQVGVDFVDPVRGADVPFNELAQLGSDLMPGFVGGWMNGRSTFVSQLAYTWPVWISLDGETRFSVGNAFGEHLDGMTTRKLRLSGDIGVISSGTRDAGFEVLFGLGTETIEDGAHITSVRLSFGSRKGF